MLTQADIIFGDEMAMDLLIYLQEIFEDNDDWDTAEIIQKAANYCSEKFENGRDGIDYERHDSNLELYLKKFIS